MTSFSCVMLFVHEGVNCAYIPMFASELYFGWDVMCHLGCLCHLFYMRVDNDSYRCQHGST